MVSPWYLAQGLFEIVLMQKAAIDLGATVLVLVRL